MRTYIRIFSIALIVFGAQEAFAWGQCNRSNCKTLGGVLTCFNTDSTFKNSSSKSLYERMQPVASQNPHCLKTFTLHNCIKVTDDLALDETVRTLRKLPVINTEDIEISAEDYENIPDSDWRTIASQYIVEQKTKACQSQSDGLKIRALCALGRQLNTTDPFIEKCI